MRTLRLMTVALVAALLGAALVAGMWMLPPAPVNLPDQVASHLGASGVEHPVTAVLLNFRGYDTLLEIAVLLLALFVILAVTVHGGSGPPAAPDDEVDEPVVQGIVQLALPVMVLAAMYLLWAGAYRPGGAFQAGAILAAAAVLMRLTGLMRGWAQPDRALRWGMAGGFLVFLAVAALLTSQGALLQYPPQHAGVLILLIEAALTVTLALQLAGLFLLLCRPGAGR